MSTYKERVDNVVKRICLEEKINFLFEDVVMRPDIEQAIMQDLRSYVESMYASELGGRDEILPDEDEEED